VVRFDQPYAGQRIFDIAQYLLERESPGILNWHLKGLRKLYADYAQSGDIILNDAQQKRVSDLLSESDSLRLFVKNEIVWDDTKLGKDDDENYSLTSEEIITEYVEDCVKVKGWIPLPYAVAEKRLPDLMLQYFGITKSHGLKRGDKSKRGWWNVRWAQPCQT
jgi:phage/plasmid-associated DNA primase